MLLCIYLSLTLCFVTLLPVILTSSLNLADKEIYRIKRKTTWKIAASSIACAKFCLKDVRESRDDFQEVSLHYIVQSAVWLEWARRNGFAYLQRLRWKGKLVRVLQWAKEKRLTWYCDDLCFDSAPGGHIPIFECILYCGHEITEKAVNGVSQHGHLPLLVWMKDHELLGSGKILCNFASFNGGTQVLERVACRELLK